MHHLNTYSGKGLKTLTSGLHTQRRGGEEEGEKEEEKEKKTACRDKPGLLSLGQAMVACTSSFKDILCRTPIAEGSCRRHTQPKV